MENANAPGTVLVVEDEAMINWDVADTLRDDGLKTLQAFSAEEALAVLEKRGDIRLVFADVNLPGMDGIALANQIQERWPQIELLMTSAQKWAAIDKLDMFRLYGRFVPKPYPPRAVARRIHEIFAAAA